MKKQNDKTILDLARTLQLSPATISRALNNNPNVKAKTRERILEAASELGYRKNTLASGLRSNKSNTIGLIVPRISMFFHAVVITEIQNLLHQQGYNLIICQSNDSLQLEKELADTLYASRVDAVIVACTLHTTEYTHFDKLLHNGIPVVFYDRVPIVPYEATMVKGDDEKGGYLAGKHLIENGCTRIGYISGPLTCSLYKERTAGFLRALEEQGVSLNPKWTFYQELTYDNAMHALNSMFTSDRTPDGIFTANDLSAIATIDFTRQKNILVPEQLKVIGYSNDPRSAIITPSITTIEQFPVKVGQQVVEKLLHILQQPRQTAIETEIVVTPVELIKRTSA
ncbi:LacI family DNA-binding transcriptional regulator [Danxiaibacter flavus]|uniref:LacI family DNA-binding transcriptional regulator n=1 Tax=Danxiaibacter flavus TaxID=3049108 RepID=A0ABV3ZC33_9BACT|nr:LacI family DNA-binding transcriptional regulator [Chitinophagaceae bacterium DXS]